MRVMCGCSGFDRLGLQLEADVELQLQQQRIRSRAALLQRSCTRTFNAARRLQEQQFQAQQLKHDESLNYAARFSLVSLDTWPRLDFVVKPHLQISSVLIYRLPTFVRVAHLIQASSDKDSFTEN